MRLALEHVDFVQRDAAEDVDTPLVLALQLRGCCTGRLVLGRGGRLVLETHVRGYLAEEARRFDGQLGVYAYPPATEHMLVQRERGGPQHAQNVEEV